MNTLHSYNILTRTTKLGCVASTCRSNLLAETPNHPIQSQLKIIYLHAESHTTKSHAAKNLI